MIIILDACSISNLINVFQDTSLLNEIRKCFKEVYITPEVVKEVDENKKDFLELFKNRWDDLEELYSRLKLNDYKYSDDDGKKECVSFLTKFSAEKRLPFKSTDGEYFSSLLSLYLSRLGEVNFCENSNKIVFVTDDAKAEQSYNSLFSINQIGYIIDSIDIVTILYLKERITKDRVIQYIEGLLPLYNKEINNLNFLLKGVEIKNKNDVKARLISDSLRTMLYELRISDLVGTLGNPVYRKYFEKNKAIKDLILKIEKRAPYKRVEILKERRENLVKSLVWKIY